MPWGVPLTRSKGGRGACLGGVRVREGWPRRVLSGPRAYLHTDLLHARLHLVFEPRTKGGAWWRVTTASGVSEEAARQSSPDRPQGVPGSGTAALALARGAPHPGHREARGGPTPGVRNGAPGVVRSDRPGGQIEK